MWWLGLLVLIALAACSFLETIPQAWGAGAGTVVVAQGVDPTTLDPMNHQEVPATVLANNLFDGLIERDPDLNLVPLLAESYRSVSPTYVRDREVAEAVAGQLTKAGVRTTLRVHEWGSFLNNMVYVHKAGPVYLMGWSAGGTYDADGVYDPLFRSGKIATNYYNADLDGMNDEAKQSMDPKRRLDLFHRINRIVVDDAAAMPLYQQIDLYGVNRRLVWKAREDERIKGYDMTIRGTL